MTRQDYIIMSVAEAYRLRVEDVHAKTRKNPMKEARQLAMYIMHRDDLALTWKYIGECFKPIRDHATALHACKTIGDLMETEEAMRKRYELAIYHLKQKPTMPDDNTIHAKLKDLQIWLNDPANATHKLRMEVQSEYNVYHKLFFKDATEN